MSAKRKCSGTFCKIQHDTINVNECQCTETCPDFSPITDMSGMDAVIDMAAKQFGLEADNDRQKLRILFNAYVSQYMAVFCHI